MSIPALLDTWDYVCMSLMVALSTMIAFYHVFRAQKTNTKEFLVSGKSVSFFPIVLSTVATALAPTSLQGYPLEIYVFGIQFVFLCFSQVFSILLFAHIFLPVYFNLGVSSVFQYLEYRFNRTLRLTASVVNTVQMVLFASCIIYAPALALNQVTGLHLWGSVISIGIVCILYTSFGGIKAVIWGDVIQLLVVICAMCIVLIKGIIDAGGFARIWDVALQGERLNIYVYPSEYSKDTIWTYLIGGSIFGLGALTANQMFIQRFLSNPNLVRARWSLYATAILTISIILFFGIAGLVMYVKYSDCDPFLDGIVASRDQLVPLFAVETLKFVTGFPGIFVAAMLCSTLSTLSSFLNGLAAVTLTDYIRPFWPRITDKMAMTLSKILATVYGVVCIALVALAANMGGVVRAIFSIMGAIGGPLFTVFALGVLFPWANSLGAFLGFIVSLTVGGWATIGSMLSTVPIPMAPMSNKGCNTSVDYLMNLTTWDVSNNILTVTNNTETDLFNTNTSFTAEEIFFPPQSDFYLYSLSPLWYCALTGIIGITVGLVTSIITGVQDPEELDPRLISPAIERFCRSLPEKYRQFLGYKSEKVKLRTWNIPIEGERNGELTEMQKPLNSLKQ